MAEPILIDPEQIAAAVEERIGPVERATVALGQVAQEYARAEREKEMQVEVDTFKADHPEVTGEVEQEMVQLSKRFHAGEDVDPQAYLETLLTLRDARAATREPEKAPATIQAGPPEIKGLTFDEAFTAITPHAKAHPRAPRAHGGRANEIAAARLIQEMVEPRAPRPQREYGTDTLSKAMDEAWVAARKQHLGR